MNKFSFMAKIGLWVKFARETGKKKKKKQEIGRGGKLELHPEGFCLSKIFLGLRSDTYTCGRLWKHRNQSSEGETAA